MNPGDVVYLKSGGPAMTVKRVLTDPSNVDVAWFADKETLCTSQFPVACLSAFADRNWTAK